MFRYLAFISQKQKVYIFGNSLTTIAFLYCYFALWNCFTRPLHF